MRKALNKPVHILFVLSYYEPYIGGLENLFRNLAEGLVRRGFQASILTARLPDTPVMETINGVVVHRVCVPRVADRYFFTILSIPAAIRQARRSDIIHTAPYNGALPAYLAARITRRPVVFTVLEVLGKRWHQVERNPLKARAFRLFEHMIGSLPFDRFAAISQASMVDAVNDGMPAGRGRVIYCGVDRVFTPGSSRGALCALLGLQKTDFVYVYYGRPGITKGLDILLRAAPLIQKAIPNAHLVLILADQPRAQYLAVRRAARSLEGVSIHFVPSVPRAELVEMLRDANCIVVPSLTEGFGLTAAEACALDVPVVATQAGSLPEVVSGRHVLVEPGSVDALANGVIRVGRGKWDCVPRKSFSWEAMTAEYEKLYMELK